MKKLLKKYFPFLINMKKEVELKKIYIKDMKHFLKYWIEGNKNDRTLGYSILLEVHSLEKGMSSLNPRPFGIDKVKKIIECLDAMTIKDDFAYLMGVSALKSYVSFFDNHNWTDNEIYFEVVDFLNSLNNDEYINVGSFDLSKSDFISDALIDYSKFLNSRHSVRNYTSEKLKEDDVISAINMTLKTPTACNRQMCKIYHVSSDDIKSKVLPFAKGLTGFNIDTVNLFVLTYDVSSFCCYGDRYQGLFNAGLVSMNFVNSLHSLGIGSCFIQFGNSYKEEKQLKGILGIPDCERVAVIISAGYYDEVSRIPYSTRKDIQEIYRKR